MATKETHVMLLEGVIKLRDGKVTAVHNLTYPFAPARYEGGNLQAVLADISSQGWKVDGNRDEATGQGVHELLISKQFELPFGVDDVEWFNESVNKSGDRQVEVQLKNGTLMRLEGRHLTDDIVNFLQHSPTIKK
jgi:hypothetical protein